MTALSLLIVLLVSLSSTVRQHPVSADSGPGIEGPSSTLHSISNPRRPPVKITGWIHETTPTYCLIGDHKLCFDPASPIAGNVRVGVYAMARARIDAQGQLHAENVAVLPPPGGSNVPPSAELGPPPGEVGRAQDDSSASVGWAVAAQPPPPAGETGYTIEFRGLIEEIDARYWIVDHRMVFVTDRTDIQGTPEVEALAEVKGTLLFEGIVLAKSIKVITPGAHAEVEFEGIIQSFSEDMWVVNGATVRISPVTVIQGTPAVGAIAEVLGVLQPDDSVLALQIVVTYPGLPALSDVEGLVESIEDTEWVVGGTVVSIDGNTFIDDSRAPAEVGMWALVRGLPQQDGSLLALRIRLSRPD
jgi:hypothetical protein